MLRKLLADEIARRHLSVRKAAREIGVASHATIVNALAGKPMEVETAHRICQWLGVPLSAAVEEGGGDTEVVSMLATILHAEPQLAMVFKEAYKHLEAGNLTVRDLEELLAFLAFRVQQNVSRRVTTE